MDLQFSIDRKNGISAWKQIADQLRLTVASGEYDATGMIPPENTLAAAFGVNRHTVRSALTALVSEGVLQRVQGVGTLISKRPRLVYPIGRRTRFSEGFGSVASTTSMTLVSDTVVAAGGDFARPLQLGEGALAVALDVLGWVDDQPVSLAHYWFPEDRFAGLAQAFTTHRSISSALATFGIADYVRVDTEIIGRIASAAETRLLQLPAGSVVLEARYMNADLDGKPIQYSQVIFRADRVSLKMEAI